MTCGAIILSLAKLKILWKVFPTELDYSELSGFPIQSEESIASSSLQRKKSTLASQSIQNKDFTDSIPNSYDIMTSLGSTFLKYENNSISMLIPVIN